MNGFPPTPRQSTRGFSFIEMMVAIIIITVIASLTLPVYTRLRTMATATKTAPHMKAILAGFHDYALAHNDYFPPAYFPSGAEGSSSQTGETRSGEARWLDSTIYAQVYPDKTAAIDLAASAENNEMSGGALGNTSDTADNNTRDGSGGNGSHLKDTVFLVDAAVHLYAGETDTNYYDMTFCLNRSLITDPSQSRTTDAEFTPRKRSLFADDAATMLIIEASEGDKNSIGYGDTEQIEEGARRYKGRFVHVGFMDGHVERVRLNNIADSPQGEDEGEASDDEEDYYFWTGTSSEAYQAYLSSSKGPKDAMEVYMRQR
ncbi:MAG: prepilin-type N-terminal cleavage/methylation domain-containing protein [Verrucomicrobiota bacterium]